MKIFGKKITVARVVIAGVIAGVVGAYGLLFYKAVFVYPKQRAERQVQLDTFYRVHKCQPEGYVASKYEPIRTYRCDNGLFVAEDMR